MKSYRKWKQDKYFYNEIVPHIIKEWSVQNPLGGRGMSDQEKLGMERLGKIVGYNKSSWNPFAKDSHQGGDDATTQLQSINDPKTLANFLNDPKKVSANAPLKQAYEKASRIKKTVSGSSEPLDPQETKLLVNILINSHKGGTIPFDELNQLWRSITGIIDDKTNRAIPNIASLARNNDVHTPIHLLKAFFGTGGGIFSAPSNLEEIRQGSAEILEKIYPDEFDNLYQRVHGRPYSRNKPPPTPPPPTTPSPTPGGIDPASEIEDLLKNFGSNPTALVNALQQLVVQLKGSSTP